MENLICQQCGKEFEVYPSELKRRERHEPAEEEEEPQAKGEYFPFWRRL